MRALILPLVVYAAVCAVASPEGAAVAHVLSGAASFYGEDYRGKTMANGELFDPDAMTAASWDYPLGARVRVTHRGQYIVVTITDRGPARRLRRQGRIIDLSEAAFAVLAPVSSGLVAVSVEPE